MASILERLEPLAELVEATPEPVATCAALLAALEAYEPSALAATLGGTDLTVSALRYAGILSSDGTLGQSARDQLLRLEALVAVRSADRDCWGPVMTVPSYLRRSLPQGHIRETFPVLLDLVSNARRRLVMASPFLDRGFENLISAASLLTRRGGDFLLITRELTDPGSHNSAMTRLLRNRCDATRLEVVSWEEEGLGLHMKAAVADSHRAYVGSANFTWGGMGEHAELGVYLDGPTVGEIERLLDVLADELRARRRLQAR